MKKTEITTSYGKKRVRVYTENTEKDLADQSFKKDCDVNTVIARFKKTGQITHLAKSAGVYADVSTITDLSSAIEQVQKASEAFDTLPADLRKKLNNDPVEFLRYIQDDKLIKEHIKYGLRDAPLLEPETSPDPIKLPTT